MYLLRRFSDIWNKRIFINRKNLLRFNFLGELEWIKGATKYFTHTQESDCLYISKIQPFLGEMNKSHGYYAKKMCTSSAESKYWFDIKNENLTIYILTYLFKSLSTAVNTFRGNSEKNNVNIALTRDKFKKTSHIVPKFSERTVCAVITALTNIDGYFK